MKTDTKLDHTIIGWRTWQDGSMFSSEDIQWQDLPDDGIVIAVIYKQVRFRDGTHRKSVYRKEKYFWSMPQAGLEIFCSNEHPKDRYPGAIIKNGIKVSDDVFERIYQEAKQSDWP